MIGTVNICVVGSGCVDGCVSGMERELLGMQYSNQSISPVKNPELQTTDTREQHGPDDSILTNPSEARA